MTLWARDRRVRFHFIRPEKPIENDFIESFNDRFRDERLNEHVFQSLAEARLTIEAWRLDYNSARPHQSLGYLAPEEFARGLQISLPLRLSVA